MVPPISHRLRPRYCAFNVSDSVVFLVFSGLCARRGGLMRPRRGSGTIYWGRYPRKVALCVLKRIASEL